MLAIRNRGEAKRHNEQLLAEHIAAGGDPSTAPTVDPDSVDWLTGKATRLDNGEIIQTKEGQELEKIDWNIEGTTLQVSSQILLTLYLNTTICHICLSKKLTTSIHKDNDDFLSFNLMTCDWQFYRIIVQEETKPVSQTTPEDLQMPMLKPKTQTQPESVFGNTQKSTKRDSDTAAFLDKIVNGKTNTNDTHVQPCSESCMVGESGANWD